MIFQCFKRFTLINVPYGLQTMFWALTGGKRRKKNIERNVILCWPLFSLSRPVLQEGENDWQEVFHLQMPVKVLLLRACLVVSLLVFLFLSLLLAYSKNHKNFNLKTIFLYNFPCLKFCEAWDPNIWPSIRHK